MIYVSRILTTLTRIAKRRPSQSWMLKAVVDANFIDYVEVAVNVAMQEGEPLGTVLAEVFRENLDADLAQRLRAILPPHGSTSLMRLHLEVCKQRVLSLDAADSVDDMLEKARELSQQATALQDLGVIEEAADAAEHATVICRSVYEVDPTERNAIQYAGSLQTLANMRRGVVRYCSKTDAGAIDFVKSADPSSVVFMPVLAGPDHCFAECIKLLRHIGDTEMLPVALFSQSDWLLNINEHDLALQSATVGLQLIECKSTREGRSVAKSDRRSRRVLTRAAYVTLMRSLSRVQRHVDALAYGRKAHELYMDDAEESADVDYDKLARFLRFYAHALLVAGHNEAAVARAQESVSMYRRLIIWRDDYLQDLAMSLDMLADGLDSLQRWTQSVVARREACQAYGQLQTGSEFGWLKPLARAEAMLAHACFRLGKCRDAKEAMEQAIARDRLLAQSIVNHRRVLFRRLLWWMRMLWAHAEYEAARDHALEAAGLVNDLLNVGSEEEVQSDFDISLSLAEILFELGRPREAMQIGDRLANFGRERYSEDRHLAERFLEALEFCASAALRAGKGEDARRFAQEGAEMVLDMEEPILKKFPFWKLLSAATQQLLQKK